MRDARSGDLHRRIARLDAWIEEQHELARKDLRKLWQQPALHRPAVEGVILGRMRLLANAAQTLNVLTTTLAGIGDADADRLFRDIRARLGGIQIPQHEGSTSTRP